ncbi:surfactin synthase thioesterase subunit [Streptomyces sp. LBL]|uniref:thioesterase II family protein n=1 Tax=Streptomyces sp. LBL TaxID=2940562 RepID=UPI0024739BA5|nr:alpha/beta fold hydrolase [Streptomyces sp. LBL]MDH6626470.1 surfactin synthase thioesterase subunit [Streptomyces sp. LBL]
MQVLKSPAASVWFRTFVPHSTARLRLFCFPHAGGGASAFRELAALAPPEIEVTAVQYPGRQDRFGEPPLTEMSAMVGDIAGAMETWLDRPVAFFGHSMGATVAFETARLLRRRYPAAVTRLFASARKAPQVDLRDRMVFPDDTTVMEYVRGLGGIGAALLEDADLRELTLPTLRGDFALLAGYRFVPGAPLTCPLTVINGADDAAFTERDALLWARHTAAGTETHTFPGGHFYLESQPRRLMEFLARRLGIDPVGDTHA